MNPQTWLAAIAAGTAVALTAIAAARSILRALRGLIDEWRMKP
jgi:hypothetical protein